MSIQLPNPHTPMAFLPPDVAFQLTIKTYIAVGTTAVFVWDIVNGLSGDYRLLTKYPFGVPTLTYFASRYSTLVYVISCAIFDTAPVIDCARIGRFVDWFVIVVVSSTSFLFVLRVWAVFSYNRYIVALFSVTWISVIGATSTIGFGLRGSAHTIGTTHYCMYTYTTAYISSSFIVPFIHDTLVFVAITYRLVFNTASESTTLRQGVQMFLFGDYLPAFSRALYQDGQKYYLTIFTSGLITTITFYLPFPPAYKILFSVPNIMLTNIMACRVYRNTKFGRYSEATLPTVQLRFSSSSTEGRSYVLSTRRYPTRERPTHQDNSVGETDNGTHVLKETAE